MLDINYGQVAFDRDSAFHAPPPSYTLAPGQRLTIWRRFKDPLSTPILLRCRRAESPWGPWANVYERHGTRDAPEGTPVSPGRAIVSLFLHYIAVCRFGLSHIGQCCSELCFHTESCLFLSP
ncbi:hypothetical protein BgiBS90_020057 [Biomphalaria glabrata]|nr:hypothetical protein BgiBS90_020057 [Biomphalaria glabrata]